MNEYLTFHKMITPLIIQIVFWLGLVVIVIGSIASMFQYSFWAGLASLVGLSILWRVWCELVIIFFGIHKSLDDIRAKTVAQ